MQERFSLRVRALEFNPLGWDAASWSYRVEAESGMDLALNIEIES